jgi:S-adenosylmethionine:tRNA ribosyltransferase-isomerase
VIAAHRPVQRPRDARLLLVSADGRIIHAPRSRFIDFLNPGDLAIANDAVTLPASLHGVHVPSGAEIEVRLAGTRQTAVEVQGFSAIVFGAGDFRTRTEDRPPPPTLAPGDGLVFPSVKSGVERLVATIEALLDHPRLVSLTFSGSAQAVWAGLARHGRPIQYAHVPIPLALWDVWTPIAGAPAAFEAPSAGFALDWATIRAMRERGIRFATITLAAGISSTGDPELDRRLPFDEPYRISDTTASAIRHVRSDGGRVIAIGTTVVRALEHAAARAGVVGPGEGIADQRLGPSTRLRVVDAILSGAHEPGSSHYRLLCAFLDDATLVAASAALEAMEYRTHEFGDSVLIEKSHSRSALATRQEPTLRGNGHRLRAVVGTELVEDRRHVEFDRPLCNRECVRDLAIRLTGSDQAQHAALPRAQQTGPAARLRHALDELRGDPRAEVRLPRVNLSNGRGDLRRRRSLQQVASRAAANRAKDIVIGIVGREDDNAAVSACEARDAVDLASVRQLEIQKDDVRVELRRQSKALADGACRSDDVDVALALEHRRDPLADNWMILDEEDFNHAGPGER